MSNFNNHIAKVMIMHCRAIIGETKVKIKFNSKMIIYYKIRKRLRYSYYKRSDSVYVPCLTNRQWLSVAKCS
jgi:hypothetical protein